jgi:hypothetical protein
MPLKTPTDKEHERKIRLSIDQLLKGKGELYSQAGEREGEREF